MKRHTIEILTFDGCPNIDLTLEHIDQAVAAAGAHADVGVVRVESDDDAVEKRFIGSPTVRVDGHDVEPGAAERADFGLQCRVYQVEGRLERAPQVAWIHAALVGNMAQEQAPDDIGVRMADCCAAAEEASE